MDQTFEQNRSAAYRLLGDAQDLITSDPKPPTRAQALAMRQAAQHIAKAKAALNRAVGRTPS